MPPAAELFILQRAAVFGKQPEDLLFRLEGLDHREAVQTVAQGGGKVAVPVGDARLRRLQPVSGQDGRGQRQEHQPGRDGGQQRRIPQHHAERAQKRHQLRDDGELLGKEICFNAPDVVGQRRKIGRRTLVPEGKHALVHELPERKFLALPHGARQKARLRRVFQQAQRHIQRQKPARELRQRPKCQRPRHAGGRVDELLHEPRKNEVQRSAGQRGQQRKHQIKNIHTDGMDKREAVFDACKTHPTPVIYIQSVSRALFAPAFP